MFLKKGVLKIFSKFTGEQPCKFTGEHSVNLLHIFRTPFPRNTSWWLLIITETQYTHKFRSFSFKVSLHFPCLMVVWLVEDYTLAVIYWNILLHKHLHSSKANTEQMKQTIWNLLLISTWRFLFANTIRWRSFKFANAISWLTFF